jgi:uncharacterized protein YccT (UPF0319 family)
MKQERMTNFRLQQIFPTILLLVSCHPVSSAGVFGDHNNKVIAANESRVVVTKQAKLLEIDATKYDNNLLNSGETVVNIEPGYHEFMVRYDVVWDIDYDNFDPLQSEPVKVSIITEGGKSYRIDHRPLGSYQEAVNFSRNPEFFVVDAISGSRVTPATKKSFLAPEEDTSGSAATDNKLVDASSISPSRDNSNSTFTAQPEPEKSTRHANTSMQKKGRQPEALPMLQYWWQQATVEEKQRFYQWLQDARVNQ